MLGHNTVQTYHNKFEKNHSGTQSDVTRRQMDRQYNRYAVFTFLFHDTPKKD
jgi:hypothetical protein